jgi:hypothetical protein
MFNEAQNLLLGWGHSQNFAQGWGHSQILRMPTPYSLNLQISNRLVLMC